MRYICTKYMSSKIPEISISGKQLAILILTTISLLPFTAIAQPGMPNAPVPLDGGLIALLAAGAAYGAKKYRDKNQQL
jgi:hypothetical protein